MIRKIILILYLLSVKTTNLCSQVIREEDIRNSVKEVLRNGVMETYKSRQFRPVWTDAGLRIELERFIEDAENLGLHPRDYRIKPYGGVSGSDSAIHDIKYTEAAIHLLKDLREGNRYPKVEYRGLDPVLKKNELPALLSAFIDQKNFTGLASRVQPNSQEYRNAVDMLVYFKKITRQVNFADAAVTSVKANISNHRLVNRLIQLGFLGNTSQVFNDSTLVSSIIAAQRKFGLLSDGKIRNSLIYALNIPIKERIEQLTVLLNIIRWSFSLRENGPFITLNIPSATLMVYEKNEIILSSKVIIGKKSTPTPTLTADIEQIILYPYWVVPYKIATREILPRIKKDITYLDRYHFQVIDNMGRQVNPGSIHWRSLSTSYFPYTLRQATGCDNSLGLIKFDFPNPFSVYLHDTPGKELFEMNRRFFSHGCMRVEKPVDLAHILLGENRQAIDTLTEKGCLFNQNPIPVRTEKKASLAVLYSTAWYNEEGEIFFYEDVYGKNSGK